MQLLEKTARNAVESQLLTGEIVEPTQKVVVSQIHISDYGGPLQTLRKMADLFAVEADESDIRTQITTQINKLVKSGI